MSDSLPKSTKIIVLEQPHLKIDKLNNVVLHCSNLSELRAALRTNGLPVPILVCPSNRLFELDSLFNDSQFDTLYVLNDGEKTTWQTSFRWDNIKVVNSENELMRHLCTKSMLCFFKEAIEHRKNGNMGVANTRIIDTLHSLECAEEYK